MVLALFIKLNHGLYKSCGIECVEGIMIEPCLLQLCFHVAACRPSARGGSRTAGRASRLPTRWRPKINDRLIHIIDVIYIYIYILLFVYSFINLFIYLFTHIYIYICLTYIYIYTYIHISIYIIYPISMLASSSAWNVVRNLAPALIV